MTIKRTMSESSFKLILIIIMGTISFSIPSASQCKFDAHQSLNDYSTPPPEIPEEMTCDAQTHTYQLHLNQLTLTHPEKLTSVRVRQISSPPPSSSRTQHHQTFILEPNRSGVIKNRDSGVCVRPQATEVVQGTELVFSNWCGDDGAMFTFTQDGLIVHNKTGLCWSLSKAPAKQHKQQIVLSQDCGVRFQLFNGLLQMKGTQSCVHPWWGVARESHRLCVYPDCGSEENILKYYWHHEESSAYRFGEFRDLQPLKHTHMQNNMGMLMNFASKLCIAPTKGNGDDDGGDGDETALHLRPCTGEGSIFTSTKEGALLHKQTGRCVGVQGGKVRSNVELVLCRDCCSHNAFTVMESGVIKMEGTNFCVHPCGGVPRENVALCLFGNCKPPARLRYVWYNGGDAKADGEVAEYVLPFEMNHVQVQSDEEITDLYVLTAQPQPPSPAPPLSQQQQPNIVVLCLEEVSSSYFQRNLPHVQSYMSQMGFRPYHMHSAISDKTVGNIAAVLNGASSLYEQPHEAKILEVAARKGYTTMLNADDPAIMDELKLKLDSVHHTAEPFYRFLNDEYKVEGLDFCVNGRPMYEITLNYLSTFFNAHSAGGNKQPTLSFTFLSKMCRSNFYNHGYVEFVGAGLLKFLQGVSGLQNTIIVVHSLRGGSTKLSTLTERGRLEERNPMLQILVSVDISNEYMLQNGRMQQLSTPYDIYETLYEIVTGSASPVNSKGVSLLKTSESRSCVHANVDESVCPCSLK